MNTTKTPMNAVIDNRNKLIITLTVMIFGLSYGLSAPLIAIKLTTAGFSEVYVGINAAMHAVGVFAIAPFLPMLCRRFSPRQLLAISLGALVVLLAAFPFVPIETWFVLRLGLGLFSEIIMVVSETWLNHTTVEQARAKTMAMYVASLSLGFALGPFILSWLGNASSTAFFVGSLITILAGLSLLGIKADGRPIAHEKGRPLSLYLHIATLALVAAALNGALESAGMNMLVIYAINVGWPVQQATWLLSMLLFGAIALQLPIGWLADRMDRRRLIIVLSALSAVGALIWPLALTERWLSYGLLFVWGGVFVGIYTVVVTQVGERFSGTELVGVYSALSVAWGIGALLGPVLAGVSMQLGLHGLPLLTAALCVLFTLFAVMHTQHTPTPPQA
ncbi:MFS transporter [Pseudomonas protegens]|uniref:MFS transporter n=1 Tax=Pseudomonas protegens TaxID=380021 RepID=UPI00320B0794